MTSPVNYPSPSPLLGASRIKDRASHLALFSDCLGLISVISVAASARARSRRISSFFLYGIAVPRGFYGFYAACLYRKSPRSLGSQLTFSRVTRCRRSPSSGPPPPSPARSSGLSRFFFIR